MISVLQLKRIERSLLFLTLLFLPTQLGKHFWPNFSYVYSLPIDYLSPTLYFWDLLAALLLLVFILQRQHVKKIALNLFLIFFLSQVLSLIPLALSGKSLNLGAGLVRVQQYLLAGLFGVYLSSINLNQVKSIIFWSLGLSILGQSVLAILQFNKGATLGLWFIGERTFSLSTPGIAKFDFYGRQFLRPYATLPHPNVLAAFLILMAVLLTIFFSHIKEFKMIVLRLVTALAGLTVLLTVSRAAIAAGLMVALILLRNKGRIILMVITLILFPILFTRFSTILSFDQLSLIRREQLSQSAIQMWLFSPHLGIGLNNFIPISSSRIIVGPSRFLQPVHNIFLLELSETGIVGLTGFLVLIGYPILRLFKQRTFLLIWMIIIFLGMFDHYFLTLPQGYRMLFLIWGLSLSVLE